MVSCLLNGQTSAFTYGADDLRRSMTVGSGPGSLTTDYAYDGQSMLREMQVNLSTGSLAPAATYLTGPRGPEYRRDDTQTETDGQGHTFGKTRWYVSDGLGSVVGEVDPLGNLTCSDEYDVYGAVRGRAGTASTAHGFVGSLGHLSDASTGLIYMRARYYDPSNGRFASQDPKQEGNNWFTYCDNNPINYVDGTGKDKQTTENWLEAIKNISLLLVAILTAVIAIMLWPEAAALAMTAIGVVFGAAASLAWCAAVVTPAVGLSLIAAVVILTIVALACDQIMYDMDHEGDSSSNGTAV